MPGDNEPKKEVKRYAKPLSVEEFQKLKEGDKFWVVVKKLVPRGDLPWQEYKNIPEQNYENRVIQLTIHKLYNRGTTPFVEFTKPGENKPKSAFMVEDLVTEHKIFLTEEDARKEYGKEFN